MKPFQFDAVFAAWPLLLKGTWITVQLSLTATLLGLVVAIFCAWGKTGGPGWLRFLINAYIEVIRNTPFLVQLFFFFFALPSIGLRWSPYTAALTAMVVNLGAYAAEIVRAGIESIPKGQIEAGKALNLKPWEIFRPSTRHELRQMAIGLRMQATPLQMAMVSAAIAQGAVVAPRLLLELNGKAAREAQPKPLGIRLDRIRAGMKGVVDSGTAAGAFGAPSLAPLLLIVVSVAGLVFGEEAA
eukprot:gene30394-37603_t